MERLVGEVDLARWAVVRLREVLPSSWEVVERQVETGQERGPDAVLELRTPKVSATVVVVASTRLAPRDVDDVVSPLGSFLARFERTEVLIVAPSLSERTQDRLRAKGFNYLDQNGNAYLRVEVPALFIHLIGRRPRSKRATIDSSLRLSSATAARVLRTLIDVRPPFTNSGLARAANTSPGYVSKLIVGLDREQLVTRGRRGSVTDVDWEPLIRRWAEAATHTRRAGEAYFIARQGAHALAQDLADRKIMLPDTFRWAVSGSFAATLLAPVTGATLLSVVVDDPAVMIANADLLPVDGPPGADVRLVPAYDPVVYLRGVNRNNLPLVALPEIVADCLTGTGRAPAEAEALLRWMGETPDLWRTASNATVEALDLNRVT